MKMGKQILALIGGLLLCTAAITAQQTNADPKPGLGNDPETKPLLAEDTNALDSASDDVDRTAAPKKGIDRDAIVVFGRDVELKADDSAETVVVIGGSAKILGKVRDAVVAIGGDVVVEGEVKDAVVAVMGSIRAGKGAKLHGDVVAVGGKVELADGASVKGKPVELDFGGLGVGLRKWFVYCALMLRPLAPQVGWVWAVAGFFFLIYLLVAIVFPRLVQACAMELTRRPATTFFMGLLTKILLPLVLGILAVTGVGLLVAPFIIAALIFGAIIGKVAILESLGSSVGRRFGVEYPQKTLLAFLLGSVLITLLYMVPVLGLVTFGITSVWGLGGAVTAAFGGLRREMPQKPAAPAPTAGGIGPEAPKETTSGTPQGATTGIPHVPFTTSTAPEVPPVTLPDALAFPKASFWERMGAAFLDLVLVGILAKLAGHPPLGLLVALAYFAGMWTWKGTTVGGVVVGLKVVRLDGQPVSLLVALVRGLAAAFSVIVFFLGILWIAWDKDKQGWHDKIAGTVVVRLPRGTPLVCF